MRCHYEVLGVARDADGGTLKTAYRKGALQWHPDKNQHRLDEADVRFKELQNAYEVLSDKHERAWYDSHRDAILRSGETHQAGGDGGVTPGQRPSDELDPFQYFSTSCYNGYNDGAKGFYTVYNTVFQKLAQEERQAAQEADQEGSDSSPSPPAFGSSSLSGPEVAAFYSSWLNYSTLKDFAWADKYNPAAAPNRKVRRLMEEENKKERKGMKRTHNDAVRELVAFVRKRDKRLAAHQAEEAKRRMEREQEDKLRREEERQQRVQRALQVQEADWIQQAGQQDEQEEEEEELIPLDDFYCPLCDKSFKSQKALANHERSKQHVKAVEALRAELEEEEHAVEGSHEGSLSEGDQSDEPVSQASSASLQPAAAVGDDDAAGSDQQDHASQPGTTQSRKKSKKQKKKQRQQQAQRAASGFDVHSESETDTETAPAHQDNADVSTNGATDISQTDQDSEDHVLERMMRATSINQAAANSEVVHGAEVNQGAHGEKGSAAHIDAQIPDEASPASKAAMPSPHEGLSHEQYKKLKRHKKKHQPVKAHAAEAQFTTSCATCGLDCKSRNKLFAHLKSTGHAALK